MMPLSAAFGRNAFDALSKCRIAGAFEKCARLLTFFTAHRAIPPRAT